MTGVLVVLLIVFILGDFVTGVDTWLFLFLILTLIACGVYVAWKIDKETYKDW